MEENKINSLIIVEQLPKIKQQLQVISDEVDKEINFALSLECNEDSKTEVKKARARLNNIYKTLEEKRQEVKKAILKPYDEFLEVYDKLVKEKLNVADNTLKMRINTIESEQLNQKRLELEEFAKQHIEYHHLENIIKFEDIPLNITLSASMKSLKEEILEFITKVINDIELINTETNKEEIMYEYMNNGFKCGEAMLSIRKRHEELDKIKEQQDKVEEIQQEEQKVAEKVEEIITPPKQIIEDDEVIKVSFTITTTKEKIKKLKEFLKENEINLNKEEITNFDTIRKEKLIENIRQCSSIHNRCDYLLDHNDCDDLIEYIYNLQHQLEEKQKVIDETIKYCEKEFAYRFNPMETGFKLPIGNILFDIIKILERESEE